MEKEIELLNKWVVALRSGTYKQGRGRLRNANGEYCCLGVLCEISPDVTWNGDAYVDKEGHGHRLFPPTVILSRLHLKEMYLDLSNMNDWLKYDFNQIADEVEYHINSLTFKS